MKRNIQNFSKPVLDFINILSFNINNIYLMGTMSEKQLKYPSDYDLFEKIETKYKLLSEALQFYEEGLKNIVGSVVKEHDCYISGLMLGLQDDKPKKWKLNEFLKADLTPYIQQPAIIKIDVIKLIDGIFSDFSCVYQFFNNGKLVNDYKLFKKNDLEKDIEKFKNDGNFYKMAKRIYTLDGDEKFIELFNSDIGKIAQVISNLETLIFMLEHHKISLIKLNNEVDIIINKLTSIYQLTDFLKNEKKFINILKKIDEFENKKNHYKKLIKLLESVIKPLYKILQKNALKWLKNNGFKNL